MSFSAPWLLVALVSVPVAAWLLVLLERRRGAKAESWAPAALLPNMVTRPPEWRRRLPAALVLVGVALLLVGFARPKASFHVSAQEATLVIVLDVSGSMAANDSPPTRLGAAKAIVESFLEKVPHGYQVALLTFSDHTSVVASPTHDVTQVRAALARAKTGPQGTALADAVAKGVRVAATVRGSVKGKRPPAVVLLLSDGGQTAGQVTPQQAAARARQASIPISSILLGTPDGVVTQQLQGGYTERIQVPAQPQPLELMSRQSGGHFMAGRAAVDVKGVYDELGSRVGSRRKTVEVSAIAAAGGLAFVLTGGLLSGLWFRRLP